MLIYIIQNPALPRLQRDTPIVLPGNTIFVIKVNSLNLESQNQTNNIQVALRSSSIKIKGKSVKGFLSRTNKQTNRDFKFIYIIYI